MQTPDNTTITTSTTSTTRSNRKSKVNTSNDNNDEDNDIKIKKTATPRKNKLSVSASASASASSPTTTTTTINNNVKKGKVTKKEAKENVNTATTSITIVNNNTSVLPPTHVLNQKVTIWEQYTGAFHLAFYSLSPAFIFAIFYFYILIMITGDNNKDEQSTIAKSALVSCRTFIITLAVYAIAYLPTIILTDLFSKLVNK